MTEHSQLPAWTLTRSRRKTLQLRVYPDGRVEVRAPQHLEDAAIRQFVESRRHWLARKLHEIDIPKWRKNAAEPPTADRPLASQGWECHDGATLYFRGARLQLVLLERKAAVRLVGDRLYLSSLKGTEEDYRLRLEQWFRQQAKAYFSQLIDQWFECFIAAGHERPMLRVKKLRSRWGSLSTRGYINLNLVLMQYPDDCIEAVVVHELCHLEQMNHGPEFKALQTRLLPDWRARKQLLDQLALERQCIFIEPQ